MIHESMSIMGKTRGFSRKSKKGHGLWHGRGCSCDDDNDCQSGVVKLTQQLDLLTHGG